LEKGFDPNEYYNLILISAKQYDSVYWKNSKLPMPDGYKMTYRSQVVGLENRWDMWTRDKHPAVISIRGTTASSLSWLENFYAAMVPAEGKIKIDSLGYKNYKLADVTNSAVHVGWLIGLLSIAPTVVEQIKLCYSKGIKEFLIIGHSQGGALAYLLYSYLYYENGLNLPKDIKYKIYCSAAPKPGNQYYAFDFDFITKQEWAFRVVNTEDWVPQTPFTIQRVSDYPPVNPFAKEELSKSLTQLKPLMRMAIKYMYNKIAIPPNKAQKRFQKILGNKVSKYVKKHLKYFEAPEYVKCNQYVTCGNQIVLKATPEYFEQYIKNAKKSIFINHMIEPYLFLLKQHYGVGIK